MQHLMRRIQRGPVRGISLKLQVCLLAAAQSLACALASREHTTHQARTAGRGEGAQNGLRARGVCCQHQADPGLPRSSLTYCMPRLAGALLSTVPLQVDPDTYDMLKTLNMSNLPGVEKVTVRLPAQQWQRARYGAQETELWCVWAAATAGAHSTGARIPGAIWAGLLDQIRPDEAAEHHAVGQAGRGCKHFEFMRQADRPQRHCAQTVRLQGRCGRIACKVQAVHEHLCSHPSPDG